MSTPILDAHALRRVLAVRDLTDPAQGPHALQLLLDEIEQTAASRWRVPVRRRRAHPVISGADNYDRLGYPPDGAARAARYTRYLDADTVLRTMTTVMIPPLLEELAVALVPDVVLSCPGLVYRRDAIDRHHVGEPHQLDLWRIRTGGRPLGRDDLTQMVSMILSATVPGKRWRVIGTRHPYTTNGLQIDVKHADGWVEVGECGLAHPDLLSQSGLDPVVTSGLAMGLGLDRLLMLRKGLDDIRLLRSTDPRVAAQMLDLQPYRPVSSMPAVRRDLSIAVDAGVTEEELGDRVRATLASRADCVEAIQVLAETPYEQLPTAARERLGIVAGQRNVLLRLVLRDLERTLTDAEANALRDEIYAALHQGSAHTWAANGLRSRCPESRMSGMPASITPSTPTHITTG